jgi:protein SCO1/2
LSPLFGARCRDQCWLPCLLAFAAVLAAAGTCRGQPLPPSAGPSATETPDDLRNVGVTEHLDAQAPPDLPFVDSRGKPVHLKDFFDGVRPVILTVNYSNCPMLCSAQLNGLFTGLQGVPWNIGRTFQMLTVSMDPTETPARAERTKQKYLDVYGRPGVGGGWHVLTGRDEDIHRLTNAVGYRYAYDKQQKQYAHPAVTMILKPDGRVSRYLYGIEYDPQTLRLALVEAAEGKIGSTADQVLLYCYHYDAERGRYGPAAMKVMQAGALVTLAAIVAMLVVFWRIGEKRARAKP